MAAHLAENYVNRRVHNRVVARLAQIKPRCTYASTIQLHTERTCLGARELNRCGCMWRRCNLSFGIGRRQIATEAACTDMCTSLRLGRETLPAARPHHCLCRALCAVKCTDKLL